MDSELVGWYLTRMLVGFLGLLSPVLVSTYLVLVRGRGVAGRWLFLVAGPVLAYTVLWIFCLVVVFPATFVVIFLAPATKDLFNQLPFWYPLAEWAVKYSNDLLAVLCGALSAWLAWHIWPRWPATLQALLQRPPRERAKS